MTIDMSSLTSSDALILIIILGMVLQLMDFMLMFQILLRQMVVLIHGTNDYGYKYAGIFKGGNVGIGTTTQYPLRKQTQAMLLLDLVLLLVN